MGRLPWPGIIAAAVVLALIVVPVATVLIWAEPSGGFRPGDWAAIRFTLMQAALSALISVGLAIPLARALARRRFPGRSLLITLLGAPFILPVIVAILGLISIFGQNGLISWLLGLVGLPPIQIYGLHGVLLAHVFFNLPLATRLLLQGWQEIPAEHHRLAASLGFSSSDVQRHLEWPMLKRLAPGAVLVIFLICTTSFAVALALGGGPASTTIELAIYQAFRFEFDLGKAALLGVVQFVIAGAAAALAYGLAARAEPMARLDRDTPGLAPERAALRLQDHCVIATAAAFLLLPLASILWAGLADLGSLPASVFAALLRSVTVALCATGLTLALALALRTWAARARFGSVLEAIGYLSVAASPLVIGTGLFILVFPLVDPVALALPVIIVVNAIMALPFALRAVLPALRQIEADYGRLSASLGLSGWAKMRLVVLPRLRRPLGFAGGLAAALSMGDLGVVALFADPRQATLPMELFRLMSAYRTEHAAGAGLVLLAASLAFFWVFDRWGRGNANA
jgi:thiamine transport system permease protein